MTTTEQPTLKASDMSSTAKQETRAVTQTATEAGKEVVGAVSEQTAAVADTAKQQLHTMFDQAKQELRTQAESQGGQVVSGLRSLSDQVGALASGRPQDAGQLGTVLEDAEQKLQRYVSSLDARGPQGIVDDVSRFARQRPMVFLLGAGIAGFAIGRIVRGAAAENGTSGDQDASNWSSPVDARSASDMSFGSDMRRGTEQPVVRP